MALLSKYVSFVGFPKIVVINDMQLRTAQIIKINSISKARERADVMSSVSAIAPTASTTTTNGTTWQPIALVGRLKIVPDEQPKLNGTFLNMPKFVQEKVHDGKHQPIDCQLPKGYSVA